MVLKEKLLIPLKIYLSNINDGNRSKFVDFFDQRSFGNYKNNYRIQNNEIETKRRNFNRFFIENPLKDKVRTHHNDLKEELFHLSLSLIIRKNLGQFIPEWIQEIEIVSNPNYNITQYIQNHLTIDKPELLDSIYSYGKELDNYILDVKKFRYLTNAIIKNRFIEKNLIQYINYFHSEDFNKLINIRLISMLRFIKKGKDIAELKKSLKITVTLNSQNELWLNNFCIGSGNEKARRNIENIINDIPLNKLFLKGLNDIHQNLLKIEKKSDDIRGELGQIMTDIERDNYKTLVACCPTQDETIWNYQQGHFELK